MKKTIFLRIAFSQVPFCFENFRIIYWNAQFISKNYCLHKLEKTAFNFGFDLTSSAILVNFGFIPQDSAKQSTYLYWQPHFCGSFHRHTSISLFQSNQHCAQWSVHFNDVTANLVSKVIGIIVWVVSRPPSPSSTTFQITSR